MLNFKKKDQAASTKPKPVNSEWKKNAQVALLSLLIAIGAIFLIWQQLATPHNEQVFEAAVARAADQHQQRVSQYIANVQLQLQQVAETLAAMKNESTVESWVELQNQLSPLLSASGEEIVDARLYAAQALAPDRIQQLKLSFIDIDMLNKAANNLPVFPEAVRQSESDAWLLQWAAPIIGADSVVTPDAVLLIKTSTAGLQSALANVDSKLLKVDLVQAIGHSGQRVFFSKGSGERQYTQSRLVPNSYWEVRILPSEAFKAANAELPLWIIGLMALVFVLCLAPVLWLLFKPEPVEIEDEATRILREKYQKKSPETSKPVDETESPIELVDSSSAAEETSDATAVVQQADDQSGAIVGETYAVPESIFRAYDIRGLVGEELSVELAHLIGQAIASEVLASGDKTMIVGHDARSHSPEISQHLKQGILSTGCHVIDIGCVPTPLLNFAVIFSDQTKSGVVVTASHNPEEYNGFKILIDEKSCQPQDIQQIKQRIVNNHFTTATKLGEIQAEDFKEDYIDTILSDIAVGTDVKVVIDAANGAASELAPALFGDLGCEVVPLFCDPSAALPNHDSDPCNKENLQVLIQKVVEENATCGIALDGDGDRLVIVTPKGEIIWPDQLLMIFVKDVVGRNPGCDVVFDIKSTRHLSQVITRYGGRPVMWKTGHSHIKSKMLETNALLAGEFSGHIFFKDRWFGFDDGIYAAARLLEILSLSDETLDDLLQAMPQSISTPEIKIVVDENEKQSVMQRLIDESEFDGGEKTLIDGLRVDFAKGWGLVRASNTSSALTLRFEADTQDAIIKLQTLFKRELAKVDSRLQLDF